jgi:putative endonuclease
MSAPPLGEGRHNKRHRAERYGRWAELLCVARLRLSGYRVLARRLRTPLGEIDIVARRGRVVAIVEVKARAHSEAASEALALPQRQRLARAGAWLLAKRPALRGCALRYDLMVVSPGRWPRHIADAWRADPRMADSGW